MISLLWPIYNENDDGTNTGYDQSQFEEWLYGL